MTDGDRATTTQGSDTISSPLGRRIHSLDDMKITHLHQRSFSAETSCNKENHNTDALVDKCIWDERIHDVGTAHSSLDGLELPRASTVIAPSVDNEICRERNQQLIAEDEECVPILSITFGHPSAVCLDIPTVDITYCQGFLIFVSYGLSSLVKCD
ncbi:hypothetical protein DICVIV_06492 [Dictyocaulus viviparus]|uniref:Uncharacterized protein n=1 Tax=Dictyocaulus viviparus TaxID=29172 RepID=A0A0D8XUB9_DICVI|nr:hypothetical protein DICVIV_06492 [Dictyocaulus viviparus]